MKKLTRHLLICLVSSACFFASSLWADPTGNLVKIFNNINSISGNFTQIVYGQSGQALSTGTGTLVIERPDKFRWEVKTPMTQLSIGDGKKVWIYQPDLEQVTVNPMTQQVGQTPLAILSGSVDALKRYFTITQNQAGNFVLQATDPNAPFHQIILAFNASNEISSMTLWDSLGQKTVLTFSNIKNNLQISQTLFTFTVPKGVDVVSNGN